MNYKNNEEKEISLSLSFNIKYPFDIQFLFSVLQFPLTLIRDVDLRELRFAVRLANIFRIK